MKLYLTIIKQAQLVFLTISLALLAILPSWQALSAKTVPMDTLFFLAHTSLFFVMLIRPLADLLPQYSFIRPLVILRKGVGVFSAAIIVSFILSKLLIDANSYFGNYVTASYWSFTKLAFFAHSADVAAVILLITSNNLSKKILGLNWKRVQKLSYVYFYASGIYVFGAFGDVLVLCYMVTVTVLTVLAYLSNKQRAQAQLKTA